MSIPFVSELVAAMKSLPIALKELPAKQKKHRDEIIDAITTLAESVSQALNVVTTRCSKMILISDNLKELKKELASAPQLLNDFRLNGVCTGLTKVRSELHTVLSLKRFSIRLFQRKQLESLLAKIQNQERDLEDQFDTFLRDLSVQSRTLTQNDIPALKTYLRDCQMAFEDDVRTIRIATRELENSL